MAPTSVRARLQRLSKYAGSLASPTLSANTLLQEVCSLVGELNMSRASRGVSFRSARAPTQRAPAARAPHVARSGDASTLPLKPTASAASAAASTATDLRSVASGAALAQGDRALAQASHANRRFGPEVPEDAALAGPSVRVTTTWLGLGLGLGLAPGLPRARSLKPSPSPNANSDQVRVTSTQVRSAPGAAPMGAEEAAAAAAAKLGMLPPGDAAAKLEMRETSSSAENRARHMGRERAL